MTEDEMVGWHHRLNGQEFEQASGVDEGQGSLACCGPRGCKESDTTEQLNTNSSVSLDSVLVCPFFRATEKSDHSLGHQDYWRHEQ